MVGYPGSEHERRVALADLERVVTGIFVACGMTSDDAQLLARTLAHADLRGVHSHGTLRVPDYVKKLTEEGVDPRGRPRIVRERAAACVVDGGNSMGQIGGTFAMQWAMRRARETGVAMATLGGSNHCGAMAWFAMLPLAEDMIGIATSNALPTMAPWGGTAKIVGINPLGIAMPARRHHPLVLDTAFAGTAHGKIRVYEQKGLPIPEDWAFDAHGAVTTDARTALDGLLQPIGRFKGVGLAVMSGVLSTLLGGAAYGTRLGNMVDGPRPGQDGQTFIAIDVAAFVEAQTFKTEVDDIIDEILASPLAPGHAQVFAPGGLEAMFEARYRREGIPLNDLTLAGIDAMARQLGSASLPAP